MLQTASSHIQSQAQYTVYAYDFVEGKKLDQNRWTKLMTSDDEKKIMMQAQDLFQSQKYKKIEIKKTYFDKKKGYNRAATFHVLEEQSQNNLLITASVMLLILSAVGIFYLQTL